MRRLFRELKRRNVYRVAATYAAVAFVTLQAAKLVFPATTLDGLYDKLVVLAFVGFPIALVIAWAFELTPEGMRRTPARPEVGGQAGAAAAGSESEDRRGRLAAMALAGVGLLAAAVAGGWYLLGAGGEPSSRAAPADPARSSPQAGERSIAVLPFENMGGEESEQFTRGFHDGLLTRLFNVSGLKVISRTSVMQFRESELSLPTIADSLGVKWVMEGGVQKMGDRLQVNAQLIDPRTDTHAWAQSYRRDLTTKDLFEIQSELTKKIAGSLRAELTADERQRVERRPTQDLEAYQLYSRGRNLLGQRTRASIDSARSYFERALRQDSSFALAWVGLADSHVLYPLYRIAGGFADPVREALPEARAAARRALELDPDLAEAHASLGLIYFTEHMVEPDARRTRSALARLQRAVELKPSYAEAHHWLGIWLMRAARPDPALKHLELAVELNPRHVAARRNVTNALIANGKYEDALSEARRLERMDPERETGPALEAAALLHLRRWDELRGVVRDYLAQAAESPRWATTYLALADVAKGDTASARSRMRELGRRSEGQPSFSIALGEAVLGNVGAALTALPTDPAALDPLTHRSGPQELRFWYPDYLESLRDEPAYEELIREINRKWGLNPDGSLPDSVGVAFDPEAESDG